MVCQFLFLRLLASNFFGAQVSLSNLFFISLLFRSSSWFESLLSNTKRVTEEENLDSLSRCLFSCETFQSRNVTTWQNWQSALLMKMRRMNSDSIESRNEEVVEVTDSIDWWRKWKDCHWHSLWQKEVVSSSLSKKESWSHVLPVASLFQSVYYSNRLIHLSLSMHDFILNLTSFSLTVFVTWTLLSVICSLYSLPTKDSCLSIIACDSGCAWRILGCDTDLD